MGYPASLEELAAEMYGPITSPSQVEGPVTSPAQVENEVLGPVGLEGATYDPAMKAIRQIYAAPGGTPLTSEQGFAALPPVGGKAERGFKVSESGYSPEKLAQIEAGPMGSKAMKAKKLSGAQQVRADYEDERQGIISADQAHMQATAGAGEVEAQRVVAEAAGMQRISALQQQHADAMKALSVDAALASQQAKDEYRARLAAIPELNPHAMWDEAGKDGQFAIAVSAFVHDMLGVKGIKTSAMDTINQAIRNKIDSQIYNINNKKAVAQGFKDLYDMTVQESATKMEVEAKLHGYYLKAMESGVKAEMGKYDANVARAKAQMALTQIRQEQAKNLFEVERHIQQGIDQAYGREIQIRGQNMSAATAKADREAREKIAKMELDARKQAKEPKKGARIYDTTTSGGGALRWRIKDEFADDKELTRDVIKKAVATSHAIDGLRELNDLQASMEKAPPEKLGRIREEIARRETALRNSVVNALILEQSGKQINEKEAERVKSLVPAKDWFTNGTNRRIISQLIEQKGQEMNLLLSQTADDVLPGDEGYGTSAAKNIFGEPELTEAHMIKTGSDAHTETRVESNVKRLSTPDALRPMKTEGMSDDEAGQYRNFTRPFWLDYRKSAGFEKPMVKPGDYEDAVAMANDDSLAPRAFHAVREIAEDAFDGEQSAKIELTLLANSQSTKDQDMMVADMAKYFLNKLEKLEGEKKYLHSHPLGSKHGE